jgi:periplasmic divalent cation tolerance protein
MNIVSVYVVFADAGEAECIGHAMVDERLAACVNLLGPIRSVYRWQGAIERAAEFAAIFKTADSKIDALIGRIAALHSYEVPCITSWPIEHALPAYADWVAESVS